MEEKIIYTALENLFAHTAIKGLYTASPKKELDGKLDLIFEDGKKTFLIEIKKEVRNHQLEQIKDIAKKNTNFLLIAETIFPKIKEELRKNGIAYLDIAGNIFLQTATHRLWIDGHKADKTKTAKINRAFTPTGLKVVYLFLVNENLLNQPQRVIAEEAGVALGNINYIINGLKEQKFLIEKEKKAFQLINKKELIEKWIVGFEEKLKPTLHIGNFRFSKTEDETNWKNISLQQGETFWGGEPAGAIITNYLTPEIFTIYTIETRNTLIKKYKLVPDINGKIKTYKKFWNADNTNNKPTVEPLLAYTDLLNTGNSRCIETAKIIYDKHIKQNI